MLLFEDRLHKYRSTLAHSLNFINSIPYSRYEKKFSFKLLIRYIKTSSMLESFLIKDLTNYEILIYRTSNKSIIAGLFDNLNLELSNIYRVCDIVYNNKDNAKFKISVIKNIKLFLNTLKTVFFSTSYIYQNQIIFNNRGYKSIFSILIVTLYITFIYQKCLEKLFQKLHNKPIKAMIVSNEINIGNLAIIDISRFLNILPVLITHDSSYDCKQMKYRSKIIFVENSDEKKRIIQRLQQDNISDTKVIDIGLWEYQTYKKYLEENSKNYDDKNEFTLYISDYTPGMEVMWIDEAQEILSKVIETAEKNPNIEFYIKQRPVKKIIDWSYVNSKILHVQNIKILEPDTPLYPLLASSNIKMILGVNSHVLLLSQIIGIPTFRFKTSELANSYIQKNITAFNMNLSVEENIDNLPNYINYNELMKLSHQEYFKFIADNIEPEIKN